MKTCTSLKFTLAIFLILSSFLMTAQTWQTLNVNTLGWRFEDMQFVNPDIGWVVDGGGQILKTDDGGETWTQQYYNSDRYFRSVEFFNDQIGFAGTLANGEPTATLLKTIDGGTTWTDISATLPVDVPGICGMHFIDENTIFITGTFYGSGYIMKSTNQGQTWTYTNMQTICNGIVDIYFKDENIGFAVGQSAVGTGLKAAIIGTTNGGVTWNTLALGIENNERVWKIQELNNSIMYASLEAFTPSHTYFKSTDGGQTWELNSVTPVGISGTIQGIGFLSEDIGWVGGYGELFYETTNQGTDWEYKPTIGQSFNRFQRVNDTLMYTSGTQVYKYIDPSLLSVDDFEIVKPRGHTLTIKDSNIVAGETTVALNLINNTYCELSIYNISGQCLQTIVEGRRLAGKHSITWNASSLQAGQYFLVLYTYHGYESIRFIVKN